MIRILIKDLYRSVATEVLEQMITHKFGLKLNSAIKFACWRNKRRDLTNIKNGDRFCFVSAEQLANNPLPREAYCSRFKVRIFHDGQFRGQRECARCLALSQMKHLIFQGHIKRTTPVTSLKVFVCNQWVYAYNRADARSAFNKDLVFLQCTE